MAFDASLIPDDVVTATVIFARKGEKEPTIVEWDVALGNYLTIQLTPGETNDLLDVVASYTQRHAVLEPEKHAEIVAKLDALALSEG